jgi:hypothetical protein
MDGIRLSPVRDVVQNRGVERVGGGRRATRGTARHGRDRAGNDDHADQMEDHADGLQRGGQPAAGQSLLQIEARIGEPAIRGAHEAIQIQGDRRVVDVVGPGHHVHVR